MKGTNASKSTRIMMAQLLLLTACAVAAGQASFSHILSFQGRLCGTDGKPLPDGDYRVTFRIYDSETGGRNLWQEEQQVRQTGGVLNVSLSTRAAFPRGLFAMGDLWLAIQIQGEPEMKRRIQLCPAAFALNAAMLEGKEPGDFLASDPPVEIVGPAAEAALSVENTGTGYGINARGKSAGGLFWDMDESAYTYLGYGDIGVCAEGDSAGGLFMDQDGSGYAYLGRENYGIEAAGNGAGGHFEDSDGTSWAEIASDIYGIEARGVGAGGRFDDSDGTSWAEVAWGYFGMKAEGTLGGATFADSNSSANADIAHGDRGMRAGGAEYGGKFHDTDSSGEAYLGCGDRGIEAYGDDMGGYFEDTDGGSFAEIACGSTGINAYGSRIGGRFYSIGYTGYAEVASDNLGIGAAGNDAGGYFYDYDEGVYAYVALGTSKIVSNGTCSSVQNHPEDADKVIVYACPEGNEVATYTRGTGKLVNGVARVRLGETFKWVTNTDIGLTAHLTPRGKAVPLAIVSLTTSELVACGPEDGPQDLAFDYIVYGLRIGFEEAYIPSMADHRALYERRPELRQYNALERFKCMRGAAGEADLLDLSASRALRDAIEEIDPGVHGRRFLGDWCAP